MQVRNLAAMSFTALAVIAARRCVLSMLLSWRSDVPLNNNVIDGVSRLIQLGKLVAAGECRWAQGVCLCATDCDVSRAHLQRAQHCVDHPVTSVFVVAAVEQAKACCGCRGVRGWSARRW